MWNAIKPQVLPVIGLALQVYLAKWQTQWLVGLVLGMLLFWLIVSILSNKKILSLAPWLRTWAPFLDGSGGLATLEQLRNNQISGLTFKIADLAGPDGVISDRQFRDCTILGPAVLIANPHASMMNYQWDCVPSQNHWEVSPGSNPIGSIKLQGGVDFKNCRFRGVGLVGTKESLALVMNTTAPYAKEKEPENIAPTG